MDLGLLLPPGSGPGDSVGSITNRKNGILALPVKCLVSWGRQHPRHPWATGLFNKNEASFPTDKCFSFSSLSGKAKAVNNCANVPGLCGLSLPGRAVLSQAPSPCRQGSTAGVWRGCQCNISSFPWVPRLVLHVSSVSVASTSTELHQYQA